MSQGGPWRASPVAVLRHAGYPVRDVAGLADEALVDQAGRLLDTWQAAIAAAVAVPRADRGDGGALGAALSALRPVHGAHPELSAYSAAVSEFDRLLATVESGYDAAVMAARNYLAELFTDPWRQQVLLLSNPTVYAQVREWLSEGSRTGARARKITDLLAMHLQRITTKNETNSHFGPFAVARFDRDLPGITWSDHVEPERRAFLAHWAGAALLAHRTSDRESVRPRPHPTAFPTPQGIVRYDHIDGSGLPYPWILSKRDEPPLCGAPRWLFERIDGERTTGELRELWAATHDADGFDSAIACLERRGMISTGPELPAGETDVVAGLHATDPALAPALRARLDEFAAAPPQRRATVLAGLAEDYVRAAAASPVRRAGQHYADRGVLFEECLSRAAEVTMGPEIERFITDELAEVYDGMLYGARWRMARERTVLARWLAGAFGTGRDVALVEVYERYLTDRQRLLAECDVIDAEVATAEHAVAGALTRSWDGQADEVRLPPGTLRGLLRAGPTGPAALCNPDVMIGAADADAIRRGEFFGVVGDCHAVRDLLTHGPFAPILRDLAPDVATHVLAGYRRVVDEDVIVDVVREHTSKISAQWNLPLPHLEVSGRSPKARGEVLLPRDLHLRVEPGGRVSLRSPRVSGRIRLMASISGADSIRYDPLAIFAFPRSLGGGLLSSIDLPRLPRLTMGRVVLARSRWRVPISELDTWRPYRRFASAGCRQFVATVLLRQRLGIPRHVFAKFPQEPKPIYVDWHAPLLVRQFHRLARAAASTEAVELSEMLPTPEQLWLRFDGAAHTAELRCTLFSR